MKNHAFLLSIILCALILFGCGKNSTDYGSQKGQACAKQAIEAITSYCNGTFTYERTKKKLDKLSNDMNFVSEDTDKDNNPNHYADSSIRTAILSAYMNLGYDNFENDAESYEELQKNVEELQKYISE